SGEQDRAFFVLDPMLATGGSAVAAVKALKKAGAARVRFLCLVAAPEGVKAMLAAHSDVPVDGAHVDRQPSAHGHSLPAAASAGVWEVSPRLRLALPDVDWVVACGRRTLSTPLRRGATAPELDGPCFHAARAALEHAKRHRLVLAFEGFDPSLAACADYYSAL